MESKSATPTSEVFPTNQLMANHSSSPWQTKTNLILPILATLLMSAALFGFGGYYLGKQSYTSQSQNFTDKNPTELIPTVVSSSPTPLIVSPAPNMTAEWKTYIDTKNRFSFKYPSNLVLSSSPDYDYIYYLETQNYRFLKDGSYKVEITITSNNQGIPKVLPIIDTKTPEGTFTDKHDFINFNGAVGIATTYKEGWVHYKMYDMYSNSWKIKFFGTGLDHSTLDQIVATFTFQ